MGCKSRKHVALEDLGTLEMKYMDALREVYECLVNNLVDLRIYCVCNGRSVQYSRQSQLFLLFYTFFTFYPLCH